MPASSDRNLVFGLLALQMDFVSRDQLLDAMAAWMLARDTALGEILRARGALSEEDLTDLERITDRHVRRHGDAHGSLAVLRVDDELRQLLRDLGDSEVQTTVSSLAPARPDVPFRPTDTAGARYRRLKPHAKGGLGEVFVAEDAELRREVALKEIQERFAADPGSRSRFLREAEITGNLEHPGIVPVYGLGTYPDGRPYYAMRLIRGESMQDRITRFHKADAAPRRDPSERSLALRDLLTRFVAVCEAVAYAHSRGVIHRDLKPANVMLGEYGETLVVDWGLAKTLVDDEAVTQPHRAIEAEPEVTGPTRQGQVFGTPAYMPPEQARGEHDRIGPAADVFALGATLYCLLTGRAPNHGRAVKDLALATGNEFEPARQVNPRVPAALEAVCARAMAFRPEGRYAGARELAGEVERWLADEPVAAYRDPWVAKAGRWARRHRTLVVALAVLFASAVVGLSASTAAVVAEQRRTAAQKELAEQEAERAGASYRITRKLTGDVANVVEKNLPGVPGAEPARRALLDASLPASQGLLGLWPDDTELMEWNARLGRISANVRRLLGDAAGAEPLYRETIRLEEALIVLRPDDPKPRERLAQTLRDFASLRKMAGRLSEALAYLDRSVEIAEGLLAGQTEGPGYRRTLAISLLERSDAQYPLGRAAESLGSAERAAELFRGLEGVAKKDADPLDPLFLAMALNRVGAARRELGRPSEALASHGEAERRLREILKRGDNPNFRHFLARTLLDQGEASRTEKGQAERAGKAIAEALGIWERLAREFRGIPLYQEYHAQALLARGELLLAKNDAASAGRDLESARGLLEALSKKNPGQASYRAGLGRVCAAMGRQAERAGEAARAAGWYRRAAEELRQAAKAAPEISQDRKALEEAERAAKRLGG
jgi:serine/threonine-protein kinase